ncbi:uncharacterized protein [Mytilus edulis]|uniref:uncharacterized protein n=1 Tax=Mytilus edulis TaxID=6550 RepID=UPI0039EE3439
MTGGGSSPKDLTQTEQKIIAIMPQTLIEGIFGGIYTHTHAGTSKSQRISAETAGTSKYQRTSTETFGTSKFQRTSTETVMTVGTAKSDSKEDTQLHSVGTELTGFLIIWSFRRLKRGSDICKIISCLMETLMNSYVTI